MFNWKNYEIINHRFRESVNQHKTSSGQNFGRGHI